MAKHPKPRHGSLAYRPRKRANSQMPSIGAWPSISEAKLLGFAGYKAGMTHFGYIADDNTAKNGKECVSSATIIETPPIVVYGMRFYSIDGNVIMDHIHDSKNILKTLKIKKLKENQIPDLKNVYNVVALCYTQPKKAGFPKKKPDLMEIGVGGKDINEKVEYLKGILGKEVKSKDIFKPGEFLDAVSITKGKGWQGPVKRFGVAVQRRKATGKYRHVGNLGSFGYSNVYYSVPQAGQMGYHKRTEKNKQIVKILKENEANLKGGFMHYGVVKEDCILIKGSIAGPAKRLIRFRFSLNAKEPKELNVTFVSNHSQQ